MHRAYGSYARLLTGDIFVNVGKYYATYRNYARYLWELWSVLTVIMHAHYGGLHAHYSSMHAHYGRQARCIGKTGKIESESEGFRYL
jgi:hypothetical protein